jgi:hypothetical protein
MSRWETFWFAPETARNLAAARIVLGLQALWILLSRDIPALSALPAGFWAEVSPSARWRYLLFEGHPLLEHALQTIALVALAGVVLGAWPRLCCLVAGLLLYHLSPLETLFFTPSPWSKGLTIPVLGLLVLALSPCGDALSLARSRPHESPAAEYAWPLRLVQALVCLSYFFSGWAKLSAAGWQWASAANMRAWLLLSNQDDQLAVFQAGGLWIADRPALCLLMGILALFLDLGFPLALAFRRARLAFLCAAALFHLAVLFTLNYAFLSAPLLLVLADWEALARAPRDRAAAMAAA